MKRNLLFFIIVLCSVSPLRAQDELNYLLTVREADSLLKIKDYHNASQLYSNALKLKVSEDFKDKHRYVAAVALTQSNQPDYALKKLKGFSSGKVQLLVSGYDRERFFTYGTP